MLILKALKYIQLNEEKNSPSIHIHYNNSIIAKNHKRHTHIIDQIKNEVMDMERDEWKVEFTWVEAHAGQRGNELADRLAKEASSSKDVEECYNRIPKSTVTGELKEHCLKQWQNKWETTTKGATTKSFFPNIEDRLQLRINPTPNFTAIVT